MLVKLNREQTHHHVVQALSMLERMAHRGACGCEYNTGDGAGIQIGMPSRFMAAEARAQSVPLPLARNYGAGLVFLPRGKFAARACRDHMEGVALDMGLKVVWWRSVPTDNSALGAGAKRGEPLSEMMFVVDAQDPDSEDLRKPLSPQSGVTQLDRRLFVFRKRATHSLGDRFGCYICSLSTSNIVFKGQLMSEQLSSYFQDLTNPLLETHFALVHSRFSTNTFPSWPRSQPNRLLSHNGEINTLRGNVNWQQARETLIGQSTDAEKAAVDDLQHLLPTIEAGSSDSQALDNVVELLVMSGRLLPEAMCAVIPEAWQNDPLVSEDKKGFYQYHSNIMEPWDGPAMVSLRR
jgi:glutamate synthase domain-containing protein 1